MRIIKKRSLAQILAVKKLVAENKIRAIDRSLLKLLLRYDPKERKYNGTWKK